LSLSFMVAAIRRQSAAYSRYVFAVCMASSATAWSENITGCHDLCSRKKSLHPPGTTPGRRPNSLPASLSFRAGADGHQQAAPRFPPFVRAAFDVWGKPFSPYPGTLRRAGGIHRPFSRHPACNSRQRGGCKKDIPSQNVFSGRPFLPGSE